VAVKLKHILEQLNAMVTFNVDKSMTDDDFIANVDAINLLCNLYDDLNIDRTEVRRNMDKLYPQFSRRVYGKSNIQQSLPLIKALYRYIYNRGVDSKDRGPVNRRNTLTEMCCKVVKAYNENPIISSYDFLFALSYATRTRDYIGPEDYQEIKDIIDSYLKDIDSVSIEDKILRLKVYDDSTCLIGPDNWDKWEDIRNSLLNIDVRNLDDDIFVVWTEVARLTPIKELKRRSLHSNRMQVEYLQTLVSSEFEKERKSAAKRKLIRDLKTLNDDIIGDIIPIEIDADMSVATLHALETIFYLRLQLSQVGWDEKESIYNGLCRDRFEQLAKALRKKYSTTSSINEKIEILERLASIGMTIDSGDFSFALDEAENLKELPNLTYAQKLRLNWLPDINPENESAIVAKLLPEANTSFEVATLALIFDFITAEERKAVLDRYFDLLDAALISGNVAELGKLLTLAAYWNIDPTVRHRLTEAVPKAQTEDGLTLPERLVNPIAAEIYTRIDNITGKYDVVA
jgi:hypothetical protein